MDAPGHVNLQYPSVFGASWASSPALNAVNIQTSPSRYPGHGQVIPSGSLNPDW